MSLHAESLSYCALDLETGKMVIERSYNKALQIAETFDNFNLNTVNSLILFLRSDLQEIRDDLKSKIIVRLIRRIHKSDINSKNLEKNTQKTQKFNLFIDNGLQFYVDIFDITPPNKKTITSMFLKFFTSLFNRFKKSSPANSLREIADNIKLSSDVKLNTGLT